MWNVFNAGQNLLPPLLENDVASASDVRVRVSFIRANRERGGVGVSENYCEIADARLD